MGTHALGHAANKQGLCSLCHLPEPRADALLRSCALGAGVETPTLREIFIVAVAQLAARRSHNPKVVSSILTRRTLRMCTGPWQVIRKRGR